MYSSASELFTVKDPPKFFDGIDEINFRKWKDKEDEILQDIEPITFLAKDIIHSDRYDLFLVFFFLFLSRLMFVNLLNFIIISLFVIHYIVVLLN